MKKLLQRIGAVLLCACMLMPMCPEEAFADTIITEADITIEVPKVGNEVQQVVVSVTDGANYTVTFDTAEQLYWLDGGGGNQADSFEVGSTYMTVFNIVPEDGYKIASDATIRVNESTYNVSSLTDENPGVGLTALSVEFKTDPMVLGTIDSIELTNVPTGDIGDAADQYNYDGTEYSVIGTWMVYNPTTQGYDPMQNTDVFEQGKMYQLLIDATAKPGYVFDEEAQLIIDGDNAYYDGKDSFHMYKTVYVNYVEEIDEINMLSTNYPKAEVGKTFTNTELDIAVPAGSHYKASGRWVYMDEYGNEFTEGTFESGKAYYLSISIVPEDGYAFAEEAELYIDDEPHWISMNPALIQYDERVSLKSVIDKVTLLNLPTATVGGTAKLGEFDVEVPTSANYTATATWFTSDGSLLTEPVFEENKSYLLQVDIRPNAGYDLAETLYINAYGVDHKLYSADPEFTWFFKDFSFLAEISSVEITGYTEPVVGANATVDGLKAPADANYEIINVFWYEDVADNAGEVTVFEKGKDYALYIILEPKQGYEFSRDVIVTLNGEVIDFYLYDTVIDAYKDVSFKEVITDVQISNLPIMEVGKKATTDIKVPDGVNYKAEAFWYVWDDAKEDWKDFQGTFETGKVYELDVYVSPNAGYRFSEDATTFKIEDKEYEDADIWSGGISLSKFHQTEHKVIDRVELKIEEPVVGNHASIAPVISIVGDANFTVIDEDGYLYWLSETAEGNNYPYEEYFVADENYGVSFVIRANQGYVFSEDLVTVINGKIIPEDAYDNRAKELFIDYFFGTGTEEIIDDGTNDEVKDEVNNEVKDEVNNGNDVPKTGDSSNVGMFVSIMLVGMLAFCRAFVSGRRSSR